MKAIALGAGLPPDVYPPSPAFANRIGDFLLNDVAPRLQAGGTAEPYGHEGLASAIRDQPVGLQAIADVAIVNGLLESLDESIEVSENSAIDLQSAYPSKLLLRHTAPRYANVLSLDKHVKDSLGELAHSFEKVADALEKPPPFEFREVE